MMRICHPETGAVLVSEPLCKAKGSVIICPGGAYERLSPREADPVARRFRAAGWQAYVLYYSVGEGAQLGTLPLQEAAWAVRTVRSRTAAAGLPVYLCGFSAGGHLAASLGVHWNHKEVFADPSSRAPQRPDGLILCYPVITAGKYAHAGSMENLAGKGGDTAFFSLEKHVSSQTPPVFLWHTAEDESVPVQNALLFAGALAAAGVPAELHVYPYGVHGLSLATREVEDLEKKRFADPHVAGWFDLCLRWLDLQPRKEPL